MGTVNTTNTNLLNSFQAQSNDTAALQLPGTSPAAKGPSEVEGFDIVEISARALELQAAATDTGTTDTIPLQPAPAWSASEAAFQDIKAGEIANTSERPVPLSKAV
jgi:hypothetical protein